MTKHPFHLVDPRPWPLRSAIGALLLVGGTVSWINYIDDFLISIGMALLLGSMWQWMRDVCREASLMGKHTSKVEGGLRIGIILFITREVFFFFSFFWAFFHSSLSPNIDTGSYWPPLGVNTMNPFDVPLLNTTILLSRGATITWVHASIINSHWIEANIRFLITLLIGSIFSTLQIIEYRNCDFALSDSVYGRTFYLTTGFHGLHVVIGTIFIMVMWFRHMNGHFSSNHHFGFEARAWYWHFVDVVWLFLYLSIYWWAY